MNSGGSSISFGPQDPNSLLNNWMGMSEGAGGMDWIRDITADVTPDPKFDLGKMVGDLESSSARRTNEQAADLRESFGVMGSRFGTPLASGEARLRSDANNNLDITIGNLMQQVDQSKRADAALGLQANQLGVQRDMGLADLMMRDLFGRAGLGLQAEGARVGNEQQNVSNLLNSFQMLQGFGTQNISPFLMMAQLGILPQEVIASPNPWLQFGTAILQGLGGAAGAAAGK